MTNENRRLAIAEELTRGVSALKAAHALRDLRLYNDALSRLYYALFHHATALLLTEGIEPSSHRALPGLLGKHFVLRGALTPEDVDVVGHAWSWRGLADYERTWEATEGIATRAFGEVEPLLLRITGMLKAGAWIAGDATPV